MVGAKNQFAPGVLSRPMTDKRSRARAEKVAGQVLAGKRHRGVGKAMFFHTAGRTYRFENMHYVLVEGGNAFYERKPTGRRYIPRTMIAQAGPRNSIRRIALGLWQRDRRRRQYCTTGGSAGAGGGRHDEQEAPATPPCRSAGGAAGCGSSAR